MPLTGVTLRPSPPPPPKHPICREICLPNHPEHPLLDMALTPTVPPRRSRAFRCLAHCHMSWDLPHYLMHWHPALHASLQSTNDQHHPTSREKAQIPQFNSLELPVSYPVALRGFFDLASGRRAQEHLGSASEQGSGE